MGAAEIFTIVLVVGFCGALLWPVLVNLSDPKHSRKLIDPDKVKVDSGTITGRFGSKM